MAMQREGSGMDSAEPHSLDNTGDLSSIALHASLPSSRTETPLPLRRNEKERQVDSPSTSSSHNDSQAAQHNDDNNNTPRRSSAACMSDHSMTDKRSTTTTSFGESKVHTLLDTTAVSSSASVLAQHEVYRLNRELLRRRGESARLRDTVAELRRRLDSLASEKQTLHVQLHDCQDRLRESQQRGEEAKRAAQDVELNNVALLAERAELEKKLTEAWQRVAELMQKASPHTHAEKPSQLNRSSNSISSGSVGKGEADQTAMLLLHAEERAKALQRAEDSERHMRAQLSFAQRRAQEAETELHEARRRLAALLRCVEDWTVIEHRVLQLQTHKDTATSTSLNASGQSVLTPPPPPPHSSTQRGVPTAGPVAHYPATPPRTSTTINSTAWTSSHNDTSREALNTTPSKTSYPSLLYGLRHDRPATPPPTRSVVDKVTMTPERGVAAREENHNNNTSIVSSSASATGTSRLFAAEVLGVIEALDRRVTGALHHTHLTA